VLNLVRKKKKKTEKEVKIAIATSYKQGIIGSSDINKLDSTTDTVYWYTDAVLVSRV